MQERAQTAELAGVQQLLLMAAIVRGQGRELEAAIAPRLQGLRLRQVELPGGLVHPTGGR